MSTLPPSRDNAEHWAEIEALFQQALSQGPDTRRAFLSAQCADAADLAEVEALLAAHERRGLLDELADEVMAPILTPRPQPQESATPQHSRYRVLERIGGGGMGVVYRARDDRLGRDVALKFLSAHLSQDPAAKRRFLVEARAAAALEHPNICTVHEIGDTEDGQLYIVMACYEGETLDQRIARGPLPLGEAIRIATDIARGLQKAHERDIVHRDIKPANVMCTRDGHVKLLDFGIAKLADVAVTQTVGAVGTVAYMSPEQALGDNVDHRSDLWSLGVVLYEMLATVRPFVGPSAVATLTAIATDEPQPISVHRPTIPTEVDALLKRLLAKQASDRPANAGEVIAALAALPITESLTRAAAVPRRESALTRAGERRPIVMLRAVVGGAERLVERLTPEELDRVAGVLRSTATTIATQHAGLVNEAGIEGLTLLFGVPVAAEDDALRAVRAAQALVEQAEQALAALGSSIASRVQLGVAVHAGPAVVQPLADGSGRYRVAGNLLDVATRLAGGAESKVALISPDVRRMVDVRDRTEPPSDHLTPFAGRERERSLLAEHLAAAAVGNGRLTVLIAEAGAGKSRLLHEVRSAARAQGLRVLYGRCDARGGTTPFLPFVEAVQDALGVPARGSVSERHDAAVRGARALDESLEASLPLFLRLLGLPSTSHPLPGDLRGELFQAAALEAIAALFTLGAREQPLALLLEDWHWADEASRAALRQLGEIVGAFPIQVLVTARPEGVTDWGSGEQVSLVHLSPLDGTATEAIARASFRATRVAAPLVQWLHERTGGNPFFLEEVCEALLETGAVTLRDEEAFATAGDAPLEVPSTVQGVLRARIDRLEPATQDTLRVAAVIGREFTRGVLEAVVEFPDALGAALERLKSSGLVQQIAIVPEPMYRFKHVLTQDVAYDSLLEHQRRSLHAAVGRAIEQRYAAQLDKHVERLAHHFGLAEEWEAAVRYGLMAADRAMALSQNADVMSTLERAEAWARALPEGELRRDLLADVLLRTERLCETLGQRTRQLALVESLIALLAPHGASERLAQAYLRQGDAFTLLRRFEAAERSLLTARQIAAERGDGEGERNALRSLAFLRSHEGRHREALDIIEDVIERSEIAGDLRAEHGDLATVANILRALGEPERARDVLQEAIDRTNHALNPARYGALLNVMATLHRDLGDYPSALDYYRRTRSFVNHTVYASFSLPGIAYIQLQQGEIETALATYREAIDMNRKARYADGTANASRSLGEVLLGLQRFDEALPPLREAATLFAQLEDAANESLMRRRIAEVEERRGAFESAKTAWRLAADRAQSASDSLATADALEGIARAERRLDGPTAGVVALYEEALGIIARAGDRKRELALRNGLGIVHWQRGAFAEAVRHYEAALRICRESEDRVHEGLILNSLGATLIKLRRWDEARLALADGVRTTEASGEQQLQAHALGLLGEVCLSSGRLDEARHALERSLAIRVALGDRRGQGWMLEHTARLHLACGDLAAAQDSLTQARRVANEITDPALVAALDRITLS